MKLKFLFQPNIFLSKRTKAIVVITIAITVREILVTGVTVNLVCALGWLTCAGTSIDVILCYQWLSNPFPGSRGWLLSSKLRSGGCKIGSSPFLFFFAWTLLSFVHSQKHFVSFVSIDQFAVNISN